jgi:hypothetical protein
MRRLVEMPYGDTIVIVAMEIPKEAAKFEMKKGGKMGYG